LRSRVAVGSSRNEAAAQKAGTSFGAIQAYMEERGLLKMMDSIAEAGQRAAKIVDNMLNFSRKDGAHFEPHPLDELLEQCLELAANEYGLKKQFGFRHIRIVREYGGAPGPVPCEAGQIQQVILNLLSNSAQAMAGNPPEQPRITLRLGQEDGMALIEIEDNGPGMDAETRKRVFEPFFTTKGVGHGTGLGLSVSYFIVTENHRGTMGVRSAPGKGACFSIRIPLRPRQAKPNIGLGSQNQSV
jgi:signal transduction histidine kinase